MSKSDSNCFFQTGWRKLRRILSGNKLLALKAVGFDDIEHS